MKALVEAKSISVSVGSRCLLQKVDLTLSAGEIVTVIGPNGAGKTTLVKVIVGLRKADTGTVSVKQGTRIGYMPQRLHIDQNLPITVKRFLQLAGQSERAIELTLAEVGISHLLLSPMQAVSGGEMQRILLARALLRNPHLLVLDEPVQGVDIAGQSELYELISSIRDRRQCGVLMVSHDLHLVMAQTDTVVCLNHHVCCHGHPEQVSHDPAFIELFGRQHSQSLAIYQHDHDHDHTINGDIVRDSRSKLNG